MKASNATLRDARVDDSASPAIVEHSELCLVISDFESLVAAGLLHGTRHEAAQFFSGWLAFGDQHDRPSPDSLRLIVLPGFANAPACTRRKRSFR
jgi:hypothetical protein